MKTCSICWTDESDDNTLKSLPIYVYGSEGVEICFPCEMAIVATIRNMASAAGRSRKIAYKHSKKIRDLKQQTGFYAAK